MTEKLNQYGDAFRPTEDGRGVDISSQREDDLDRAAREQVAFFAKTGSEVVVVELGGGFGAHAIRMAQAGARVVMVDVADTARAHFEKAVADGLVKKDSLVLVQKDFRQLDASDIPAGFQALYSQRAIHYLRYEDAKAVLGFLFNRMAENGKAFISAAGFDTEYGKTFADRAKPVRERFALVAPDMQAKHGILHPIVTYTDAELKMLLEESGFKNVKTTVSAFGNIKAVADR